MREPKGKISTGCFVETTCCVECDWWSRPLLDFSHGGPQPPRSVCPKCGGNVEDMRGQFLYIEVKGQSWFSTNRFEYVGFNRDKREVKKMEDIQDRRSVTQRRCLSTLGIEQSSSEIEISKINDKLDRLINNINMLAKIICKDIK